MSDVDYDSIWMLKIDVELLKHTLTGTNSSEVKSDGLRLNRSEMLLKMWIHDLDWLSKCTELSTDDNERLPETYELLATYTKMLEWSQYGSKGYIGFQWSLDTYQSEKAGTFEFTLLSCMTILRVWLLERLKSNSRELTWNANAQWELDLDEWARSNHERFRFDWTWRGKYTFVNRLWCMCWYYHVVPIEKTCRLVAILSCTCIIFNMRRLTRLRFGRLMRGELEADGGYMKLIKATLFG